MSLHLLFEESLRFLVYLLFAPLLGAVLGGLLVSVLQAAFGVKDRAFSLLGRLGGFLLAFVLMGASLFVELSNFSARILSGLQAVY